MTVQVCDVAQYILESRAPMSHMKLQKLVYYAQAWSLVWDDAPLFPEPIQAWINGPVVRSLFSQLRRKFTITATDIHGDSSKLTSLQKSTIDSVLDFYADKNAQWLSDLTHMERPWQQARKGLAPNERGEQVISHASLSEYYSSLQES